MNDENKPNIPDENKPNIPDENKPIVPDENIDDNSVGQTPSDDVQENDSDSTADDVVEVEENPQQPEPQPQKLAKEDMNLLLRRIDSSNSFLMNMLSTICGIFVTGFIMFLMLIVNLIFLIITGSDKVEVKDNSVLVLNLKGEISEKAEDNVLGQFTGQSVNSIGLDEVLMAIDKAEKTPEVKGIYLETGILETDYATLQEIRNRIEKFRKSGKWVVSYADQYLQGAYYLASAADKVYLNPQGIVDWHGLASQPVFYKDLMAKFGVKMNVVKVGKFKSYTEQYTEDQMSEANREQVTKYITGLWDNVTTEVGKSRKISQSDLNTYADSLTTFEDPNVLVQRKMVDGLLYADQVKAQVKKMLGIDDDEVISQVTLSEMNDVEVSGEYDGDEIAVYYCSGSIVMSEATGMLSGNSDGIIATKVVADLEKLAKDDDVKAVVIRINSGGGDAYASEQLWRAVTQLKAKKPVVISMGGAAASGGYYMSCNASWIVAQPTTLTGSIGIFGAFPDFSGLLTEKLGVKYDQVETNKHSAFSPVGYARPMNPEEEAILQRYVDRGYELFRQRVADGRKKSVEDIEKMAQGHVWLGQDAIQLGLVDQLGGLSDAVQKAAQLAGVSQYHTAGYPGAEDFLTQLFDQSQKNNNILDEQMRQTLGVYYAPMQFMRTISQQSPVQARVPFELNIK